MLDIDQILMPALYRLDNLRRGMQKEEWREFCLKQSVNYHLHQLLLKDPFTKCSFESRGNPSYDPNRMHYLLGLNAAPDIIDNSIGAKIFDFVYTSDLAHAVRHRRKYLSEMIDRFSERSSCPISVLSVYPGAIGETQLSTAIKNKSLKAFHIFEAEEGTFKFYSERSALYEINPFYGKLPELSTHQDLRDHYSLVYSVELLNQPNRVDIRNSINFLFNRVAEGGSLLLTAFRENVPNTLYRTYFEAFANWFLRYYSDEELIDLFSDINPRLIADFQLKTDPFCNIAYILIKKKVGRRPGRK